MIKKKNSNLALQPLLYSASLIVLMTFGSCLSDSEEELFPELAICDTIGVSYSRDIEPILEVSCYTCHSAVNAPDVSGINLEGYNNLSLIAESGRLLGAVKHEEGYTPMPLSGNRLDDCSINKIEAWINQGLQNN